MDNDELSCFQYYVKVKYDLEVYIFADHALCSDLKEIARSEF